MFGKLFLGENFLFAFKWWGTLLILGTVFFPVTSLIFKNFKCGGWIFSKVIGLGLSGLLLWFLSYAKILKYTNLNAWIIVSIFLLLNILVFIKKKKEINIDKNKVKYILIFESIFLVVFFFWAHIKSYWPEIDFTTEKYMNYGFLNVFLDTEYMPAEDMWFSGHSINYYYFGQYLASFLTKLSYSNANEAFNLYVSMVNAYTFMLPFCICYALGKNLIKEHTKKITKVVPSIIAIIAGLAVSIGGTLYYPIYALFQGRTDETPDDPYYYWEDTRYIGYRPDTNDKTINEIIPYSNLVGDLHAHHLDTTFVFLTLALLLQLLLDEKEKSLREGLLSFNIILLGIILGIQKMTNFWDFPIYLVVISLTIIFNNLMKYKFSKNTLFHSFAQILEIVLVEELVAMPFMNDLHMSATKVFLTHVTSPFYKMLVLWGLPTFLVLMFVYELIVKFLKEKTGEKFIQKISNYISRISKSDMFIFIVGCSAIGLMIIPEIIYVKDIYGDEFKRANTMYKLCYQAELMFDIVASYILIKFLIQKNNIFKKIIAGACLIMYVITFGYGINAINYTSDKFNLELTKSLDYTEGLVKERSPLDYEAINYIKENIEKNAVILDRPGGSYEFNSYISVFTGNPTILGWHGHEWIWRAEEDYSAPEEEDRRWNDGHAVYSSFDEEMIKEIIEKYNISYIYVSSAQGYIENLELLKTIGDVVYERHNEMNEYVYLLDVREVN